MKCAHVWVYGKVQGVWFRESTRQEAERLGVVGWVKNKSDGSVEGVLEGPEEAVDALVAWCHEGPATARVDRVMVIEEMALGQFEGFRVLR